MSRPDYSSLAPKVQPYAKALAVGCALKGLSKSLASATAALGLLEGRAAQWDAPLFVPTRPWVATHNGEAVVIPEPLWERVLEMVATFEAENRPPSPDGHDGMATLIENRKIAKKFIYEDLLDITAIDFNPE